MKFGTMYEESQPVAIVGGSDGRARRLAQVCEAAGLATINSVLELVRRSAAEPELVHQVGEVVDSVQGIEAETVDWAPPLPDPSKILGVAFNNKELMKKAHRDPGVPNFFMKPPSALQGHNKPIIVDPDWGAVIPEPEICAVIGSRCKHIEVDEVPEKIFGYVIHNDVTSHGLKFQKDSIAVTYDSDLARPEFYTWRNLNGPDDTDAYYVYHTRSKGTDTFGPMGPWIVTRDEIANPNDLTVVGTLDGEEFTRDHTGNYRFSVEECVAEASRYFTLEAGDLISFGTTGKGVGRFPRGHKSLLIGEETGTISIKIDPLGQLSNPIVHKKGGA